MKLNRWISQVSLGIALVAVVAIFLLNTQESGIDSAYAATDSDPWTAAQTVSADDFAKELTQEKDPFPVVIYVGVRTLYAGAHIPKAVFQGPGSSEEAITKLKAFAATLPKNSDVVLYCGCCPLEKCPNIRPAFSALRGAGFHRLRVLILPTSFAKDWVEKGYPIEKGS